MLRFLTAGESHGPGLVTIVEGLPSGLPVQLSTFASEMARRRHGHGRGARMRIETDDLEILGGVRNGETLGSPVAVLVRNTEWPKWSEVMAVEPGGNRGKITRPRPGHADLAGMLKYDTDDARNVLERASARETAARTVAGVLAKTLLNSVDIEVISHVTAIGEVEYRGESPPPGSLARIDESEVRCLDPEVSARMVEAIDRAREAKDSLGGIFEVIAFGVPVGIGSYVHYDRRLDGLLAQAVMSIPAIKGVEIGEGMSVASGPGSLAHDEIHAGESGWERPTNRAGGIEGGMSNGEPVTIRAAMKPLSTLMRPLATVDTESGEPAQAVRERSDVCAVPAAAVVGEQMMALVLAAEMQRKFGGDSVGEFRAAVEAYRTRISGRMK
jgi:chorismate synthase